MNVTIAVTLVGISALSVLAGIFAAFALLWIAPNNPLFEAIESIRELFNDGSAPAQSIAPQAQQEILSAASAVTPSSIPEPANSDAPTETKLEPVVGLSPSQLFDASRNDSASDSGGDDDASRPERQKTELVAESIQSQPSEHVFDNSKGSGQEEVLDNFKGSEPEEVLDSGLPSDGDDLLESGFAADLPDNFKIDGGRSDELLEDESNESDEAFAKEVAGSSSDEELDNQPRDTLTVDNERWQDNSSEDEELESNSDSTDAQLDNESASRVQSNHVLSANSFDDSLDEYQSDSNEDLLEELPAKPPLDASDTWAKNLSPEISNEEVLVSERSTVAVGQWEAESPAQDIIEDNNVVRGSGEETIDDRQIIGGEGYETFEDLISEGGDRQILDERKSWEIASEPPKRKSDKSFELNTTYNRGDRQKDMVLADYSPRSSKPETQKEQVIRPKEVTIEKDEEVSTEQLRLEALKNSELRDILLYLKGPDGAGDEFEIEDLTEEIGAGHERHVSRYPDGTKKLERSTFDGIAHGPFSAWYANGVPMVRGQYERGRATGFWTMWDDEETQLIHAEIGKVLKNWDYKAKVRFVQTTPPNSSR